VTQLASLHDHFTAPVFYRDFSSQSKVIKKVFKMEKKNIKGNNKAF